MRTSKYPVLGIRSFAVAVVFTVLCPPSLPAGVADFPDVPDLPANPKLPSPFTMLDGTPIKTADEWYGKRRPELKALFQHYMYGYMPPAPKIKATVRRTDASVFNGKATLKEVDIAFENLTGPGAPRIHLALFVPNKRTAAAPVFLSLNKCGNHTVVDHPGITIDEKVWRHPSCNKGGTCPRGSKTDFWCVENSIDRGYAFATFHESDIDPDKHDFSDGIHAHYPNLPVPPKTRWGTISAWAWGLHRCVDYLVSDKDIDKSRVAVIGHSRRGKTALWAGALDERISLVVPHQSGTGGCALSRDNDQETVERINRVFPHWFNDHFTEFNDNEAKLPIDQHLLMALVAPRLLLETEGQQDEWSNYNSGLRALRATDAVYKFLGVRGMVGSGLLEGDQKITRQNAGRLLQYRRDTRHTLNVDYWNAILDYADTHLPMGKPR